MLPFEKFVQTKNPQNMELDVLAFDPGETVGWAFFRKGVLHSSGQIRTTEYTWEQLVELRDLIYRKGPDKIVYEVYRIYQWKTDTHAWSEVHTAQIIGIIRFLSLQANIIPKGQTAQEAKQFCTDEKLEAWGMEAVGERHARDAIRHGAYFYIFHPPEN